MLLEFEKKNSTGCLIKTFSEYPDQVNLKETKNGLWQPWNKTVQSIFSEMDLVI